MLNPHRDEPPNDYASSSSTSSIVGPVRDAGLDVSLSLVIPPFEGFGTVSVAWPSVLGVLVPEDWPDLERFEDFSDFSDFFFFFFLMSQSHAGMKESTWGMQLSESGPNANEVGKRIRLARQRIKGEDVEDLRIRHPRTGWGIPKYRVKQPPR